MTIAQLEERMDTRFKAVDKRFDAIDHRFDGTDARVSERQAVADAMYDALQRNDPEMLRAVQRLLFENRTRDMGITLEEWKIRSHRWSERVSRARAEMREAGLI